MNKKILVAVIAIVAIAITVGYALIVPAMQSALAQQQQTKQITLTIEHRRFAFVKENFINVTAGGWTITITNVSGNVKAIGILLFDHNKPREGFSWFKLNPKVGDTISVNLSAGNYTLRAFIFGSINSTLTLTIAYP
jgi:hypothetical protein